MEFDRELIERIADGIEEVLCQNRVKPAILEQIKKEVLNRLLPVELPPCPVCGGDTTVLMDGLGTGESWRVICPDCDITFTEQYTEQEAIGSYLATPYCVMYLNERGVDEM